LKGKLHSKSNDCPAKALLLGQGFIRGGGKILKFPIEMRAYQFDESKANVFWQKAVSQTMQFKIIP